METKISIIIPVYNSEKYLKKCLDSVIKQTIKEIEIICINDGSTDKSDLILKEYAKIDSRIKVYTMENKGVSAARNYGISLAAGEYIGFIDSDDWIDEDFYKNLYNAAKTENADIAVGEIKRVNKFWQKYHLKINKKSVTEDISEKVKLCNVPDKCYVWNKIYKTKMLKNSDIRFEEGIIYEDVLFTLQILNYSKKLVTVPNTLYYYLRHGNSLVTRRDIKSKNDSIYVNKKAKQFCKDNNINIDFTEVSYRFKIFNITIYKTKIKGLKKIHCLFNIIKW